MSERDRLIDYLQANNLVRNNGFFSLSDKELNEVLLNLVQFERPDMYAVLDDKVVLLEHFQFDASYSNKKDSMTGKQTEEHLKRKRNNLVLNGEIEFEKIEYKKSFEFWQTNFERCFKKHYGKITEYKENVGRVVEIKGKPVLVGFFIEDQYPLYIMVKNHLPGICPYTDCDQVILNLHNLVVLNGIDIVPYRSDLAERSLLFELQPISKAQRKTDNDFWSEFKRDRAAIMGAIFDTLAKAIQLIPSVQRKGLHRMADANVEMIAIAMALDISQDEFQKILDANKTKLQEAYNQMNPFVDFVVSYMEGRPNVNMAAEALYKDMFASIIGSTKFFPDGPSALSRKLNLEKEALLSLGYEFSKGEKTKRNNYLIIRRIPNSRLSEKQVEAMRKRAVARNNASIAQEEESLS